MSKSLKSFPEHERAEVAKKRSALSTKGLGYWGSLDYIESLNKVKTQPKSK